MENAIFTNSFLFLRIPLFSKNEISPLENDWVSEEFIGFMIFITVLVLVSAMMIFMKLKLYKEMYQLPKGKKRETILTDELMSLEIHEIDAILEKRNHNSKKQKD